MWGLPVLREAGPTYRKRPEVLGRQGNEEPESKGEDLELCSQDPEEQRRISFGLHACSEAGTTEAGAPASRRGISSKWEEGKGGRRMIGALRLPLGLASTTKSTVPLCFSEDVQKLLAAAACVAIAPAIKATPELGKRLILRETEIHNSRGLET